MEPAWAWRVLGLPPGSAPDVCRRAFRTAAALLHPDRVGDLPVDVQAEAHRRMVELADAYRVCSALASGAPAPALRRGSRSATAAGALRQVGGQAQELLAQAEAALPSLATWDAYRAHLPTVLDWTTNAATSREVVRTLEHVAEGWPGTAEGDRARALLVTSVAAHNSLAARERAGHLVLLVDHAARDAAWDGLAGRDELAMAQVVYAHPTVTEELRRRARTRLAELGDWATIAADGDDDIRLMARAQLLLQEARGLLERAPWLSRRERPAFDDELGAWRARVDAARAGELSASLRDELDDAASSIRKALAPARSGRG
ncbi:MAG TPA: J domain-containing protein [Mycobacteriales bacterium]|nr:J domain-containing protein [Mycobacteriales bacterium]